MGSLASGGTGGAGVYEENESFSNAESTELAAEKQKQTFSLRKRHVMLLHYIKVLWLFFLLSLKIIKSCGDESCDIHSIFLSQ